METIGLIIMVAIVLEALVEYAKTIMNMVENQEYKTAITQGITIVLGVALAFIFNLQLFNNALSEVYKNISINPTIDMILTGILFSRGSNYFSDLISKLTRKNSIYDEFEEFEDTDELDKLDDMMDSDYEEAENKEEAEG